MVDETSTTETEPTTRPRRRAASRPAGPPQASAAEPVADAAEAPPAKKTAAKRVSKKAAKAPAVAPEAEAAPVKKTAKRASKKAAAESVQAPEAAESGAEATPAMKAAPALITPIFQAPEAAPVKKTAKRASKKATKAPVDEAVEAAVEPEAAESPDQGVEREERDEREDGNGKRRRRRGGRGRKRRSDEGETETAEDSEAAEGATDEPSGDADGEGEDGEEGAGGRRRRRRRRRGGAADDLELAPDDPPNTVIKVRSPRSKGGEDAGSLKGSTRLEAKKLRRREGREAGRRRAPILTEAEFLARRESVNRVMAVRQQGDRTQIAVLEDGVLVEHYVTRGSSGSMVGNVYLGRVQNVLPSMEAAFVDIGRGRNAVLYAGEVNWDAAGLEGQPKRIEFALKSGDPVLVQVTKDPVGQKGARLTSQVSLPGRFLVYVPDGSMTGISRKLPDTERSRLKSILKRVMPEGAGVIVRTASEGAPEDALEQDVARLQAQWSDIQAKAASANPPTLLYSEPDLAIKVVRDIFNEDVNSLVVSGDSAWEQVEQYVTSVAPDLAPRLERWVGSKDLFAEHRVDEQLAKALDRKVYLPSGGSLVIDRTEAMTVVDVNTGKFTGQGGNLEQTVTRNNLEAAEEIVRQLRLRDIGGIIVVDFIDMVLESNRDLVLRRLVECLGRDRTKHQVAEVTSLGLVQMTRKRIGSGLLESFSTTCEACNGRGIKVTMNADHDHSPRGRRPANAVDPADVAARALLAHDGVEGTIEEAAMPGTEVFDVAGEDAIVGEIDVEAVIDEDPLDAEAPLDAPAPDPEAPLVAVVEESIEEPAGS